MFLINGLEQNTLAVNDRATQFGDGCFTTARVVNGRVQLLPAHITRLQSACQRLAIPFELWSTLSDEMMMLAQRLPDADADTLDIGCTSPLRALESGGDHSCAQPGNAWT